MNLEEILESKTSTIARDLKLNLKRILSESALTPNEAMLALLATSTSVGHDIMAAHAREELAKLGYSSEQIQEAAESAAMMAMLNTYYRFKHMIDNEADYRSAGLRMTALAKPALGKETFEMLAFAVSVLNGCETCVRSHERVLREGGLSADKVHDLARLASVVKALKTLHG